MAYALQSRTPLLTARNRYWTGQDYCEDLERVLLFNTHDEARRWLSVHKHLRGILAVVSVEEKCGTRNAECGMSEK